MNGRYIGIDYSLTSPAVCVYPKGRIWDSTQVRLFFWTNKKKMVGGFWKDRITGILIPDYYNDDERFLQNAQSIANIIQPTEKDTIYLEGYAYGAQGMRIFQIGEATGILKTLLILEKSNSLNKNVVIERPAPTKVKKFATGKGNAAKRMMVEAFCNDADCDIMKELDKKSIVSPVDDLVDAYWICKLAYKENEP